MTSHLPEWLKADLIQLGIPEETVNATTLDTELWEVINVGAEDTHHAEVLFIELLIMSQTHYNVELTEEAEGDFPYSAPTFRSLLALFE